jgi:hypothetical protein
MQDDSAMHKGLKAPTAGPALRGKHDPPDAPPYQPCVAPHTTDRMTFPYMNTGQADPVGRHRSESAKTSGQNAAIQKCPQFLFDKARHDPLPLLLPGQKGLQISGNDTIKYRLFGIAGYIRPNAFTNDEVRFSVSLRQACVT